MRKLKLVVVSLLFGLGLSSTVGLSFAQRTSAQAAEPAKCVKIEEKISEWMTSKPIQVNQINTTLSCDSLKNMLLLSYSPERLSDFGTPGKCYVVLNSDNSDDLVFTGTMDCGQAFYELVSRTQASAAPPAVQVTQQKAEVENNCKDPNNLQQCFKANPIIQYVTLFINLLSGAIGIIVVIMVIFGGIQYSSAGGNPQAVAAAKKRIINAILALVALIFMFAFLQWLVPGGVF